MEQATQDKAREEIVISYQKKAFEALALYSYWGDRYATVEKQVKGLEGRLAEAEASIRAIENLPERHTVENREKVKALKIDCDVFTKSIKGVTQMMQKIHDKAIGFREEGVVLLEQIEFVKVFKFKTPDEIAADKTATAAVDNKVDNEK